MKKARSIVLAVIHSSCSPRPSVSNKINGFYRNALTPVSHVLSAGFPPSTGCPRHA